MKKLLIRLYRAVFARRIFRKLNLLLFHMSLRGLGVLNYETSAVSGEKHLIGRFLPKLIANQSPIFFDVGANVGNFSRTLLKHFPDAQLHAFEPHPANFAKLQTIDSPQFSAHNLAVGKAAGEMTLFDRADADGSTHASLHEEVISEIHKQKSVSTTVQVDTLDAIAKRLEIQTIDFLKIDTEGNELDVLLGAETLLNEGRIKCIHFEFNEMNIISRVFFRDFRKRLEHYDFFRLLPGDLLPLNESPLETELFAYQNIIAIPKSSRV
ncbi:MAG: FkbM family methyltransferase [bacterium]|nr:FkbM family methyltransferase [bacterium]